MEFNEALEKIREMSKEAEELAAEPCSDEMFCSHRDGRAGALVEVSHILEQVVVPAPLNPGFNVTNEEMRVLVDLLHGITSRKAGS